MDELSSESYEPSDKSYGSNSSTAGIETKSKREAAVDSQKILYLGWIEDSDNKDRVDTLIHKLTELI